MRAVKEGLYKSPLPMKKRVVLSPTSDAVRDEARFYQYRREKESKMSDEQDKENRKGPDVEKYNEVEDGEWDGGEEGKSSPRSWDFRNRSGLTEEIQ